MDKLEWLQQLSAKQPEDATTFYWLGKEFASNSRWLEAISAFSKGLTYCGDDHELRNNLLQELTTSTQQLQQSSSEKSLDPFIRNTEEPLNNAQNEEVVPDEACDGSETYTYSIKNNPGFQVIDGGQIPEPTEITSLNKVTFADVAGLVELKKTIQIRIISPFFNQGLFSKFRKKIGGGVLLYGPPGCGKTFITRATAGECKANFFPVHITDVLDSYIGVSEQNLKAMFEKARAQKPSIMFFDEIDTIGYSRSKSSNNYMRGVIDTFLTEMEGIDTSTDQVLIIGATNMPWDVDHALKRPGRFDRLIFVAPPDLEARKQIFDLKLKGRFSKDIDTYTMAKATEFFSGADIENVIERATEAVLEEILDSGVERPIMMKDMESALQVVKPTTMEWLQTAKNYVKYSNQSGLYNDVEHYIRQFGRLI
ncbi:ATP-binding protein [Brevibacillus sp. MS2.2]|uniref:ATP-binding protein n=1 Tax=Brevibacillus sp. MS2.2 TaxID=2738981 RepID=UPI00156BACE3|nr:ATP-binding protein [Brevibacillus sp. MS2.2]NRR20396.1 ATP-binding protein [Brevibacillus sp. MS2.2]